MQMRRVLLVALVLAAALLAVEAGAGAGRHHSHEQSHGPKAMFNRQRGHLNALKAWAHELIAAYVPHVTPVTTAAKVGDDIPVPFTSCGSSSDLMTLESMSSTVWPPALGTSAVFTTKATVAQPIADGSYTVAVTFNGINIGTESYPLSNMTSVPVAAGPLIMQQNIDMPASSPLSGNIGMQVTAVTTDKAPIFCFKLGFKI